MIRTVLGVGLVLSGGVRVGGQEHPGKAAYAEATCDSCHGPSAEGGVGPSLIPMTRTLTDFTRVVREGTGEMPAFSKEQVSDENLKAIHEFLKTLSGKAASARAGLAHQHAIRISDVAALQRQ